LPFPHEPSLLLPSRTVMSHHTRPVPPLGVGAGFQVKGEVVTEQALPVSWKLPPGDAGSCERSPKTIWRSVTPEHVVVSKATESDAPAASSFDTVMGVEP